MHVSPASVASAHPLRAQAPAPQSQKTQREGMSAALGSTLSNMRRTGAARVRVLASRPTSVADSTPIAACPRPVAFAAEPEPVASMSCTREASCTTVHVISNTYSTRNPCVQTGYVVAYIKQRSTWQVDERGADSAIRCGGSYQ